MTIIYYGVNPGVGGPESILVGVGTTTGAKLEVAVDNTVYNHETAIKAGLTKIMAAIQQKRLNLS